MVLLNFDANELRALNAKAYFVKIDLGVVFEEFCGIFEVRDCESSTRIERGYDLQH